MSIRLIVFAYFTYYFFLQGTQALMKDELL